MRTLSRAAVVAGLLLLMTGAAALAQRTSDAALVDAWEIGPDGAKAANLQCGGTKNTGAHSGVVIRNAGPQEAMLFFSDGTQLMLRPGEEVILSEVSASSHKCACQCTCSGVGFAEKMTFDCPSGGCAGENGTACLVFVGTELKEGTLKDCRKIYIPAR